MKIPLLACPVLLLSLLLAAGSAFGDRLYKWVDANGQVHYTNQLPPEATQQQREILNKQGLTLKVYPAPLTPEEKLEAQRLADLEARKKELAQKRANHDRSLLASFSSVEDIYKARDGKIAAIESLVTLTNSRISAMQKQLQELTEEAAGFERSGKRLPGSLLSRMASLRNQIERNTEFVSDKKQEIEDIRAQYDSDIKRYIELTTEDKSKKVVKVEPSPLEAIMKNPKIKLDRRDRTLLATYANEEELIFARDQEIKEINESIGETREQLEVLQTRLGEVSDNTSEYQDRNEIPPDALLDQMKRVIAQINSTQKLLEEKRRKKSLIDARYSSDIDRYRELIASSKL